MAKLPRHAEASQAGILVWGKIAATLAEAATPLVIVRVLGKAEVGQFGALWLVYTTIAIILSAGFPDAVLYFLADGSPARRRAVVRRMAQAMVCLGAAVSVIMLVLSRSSPQLLDGLSGTDGSGGLEYLPLLGIYALFDLPSRLMPNVLLAEGRARSSALLEVVFAVARVAGTLVPAALGWGVEGIVIGLTLVALARVIVFYALAHRLYRGAGPTLPAVEFRILFAYCIPLGATQVTNALNAGLDQWLILLSFPADQMAIYRAGAYQVPILTTIAFSVGAAYLPRFTRLFAAGQAHEALAIWRASIAKVALIVVPAALFLIVAAEEFITVAFTADYAAAAGVFRAYCFLVLLRVAAFGNVMLAAGRPGLVMRASVLTLGCNALISLPLLALIGFYGPAIGTAIAFVPTLILYNHYIARAAGVRLRETFPLMAYLRVLVIALIPALAALAFKLAVDLPPAAMLVGEGLIVLVGWAAIGTATNLITESDWAFVRRWLGSSTRE